MPAPSERVYISSLQSGTDASQLKSVFGAYGTVKDCKVLASGSACILTLASVDEAKWIVENLDGNMPEGIDQPIKADFANPQGAWGPAAGGMAGAARSSPYGGKGGGGDGKGASAGSAQTLKRTLAQMGTLPGGKGQRSEMIQLYVRGLPQDSTDADLYEIFAPFGAIPPRGVKAMLKEDGQCTGVGFVDFMDEAHAQAAIGALNGAMAPDGTQLTVFIKGTKGKGKGKTSE